MTAIHTAPKSISHSQKEVTWSPNEETVHTITYDDASSNHTSLWYSQEELQEIRRSNELTVVKFQQANEKNNLESENETMRGLETWTDEGGWERFQHVRECMNRVLDEQDRQWGVDSTEIPNTAYPIVKKINHMHIPFDYNRLGAISRDATAHARRAALIRGRQDAPPKEEPVQKAPLHPIQGLNVQQLVQKFERCSDDETVQTDAMSDSGSSILSDDEGLPEDHQTEPPVPTVVAIQIKIESLEQKHKARFAAYLLHSQQRIQAQMQKDYEWEQRRLARKIVLNQEYEEHLEKMQSMIRRRNELLRLVESRR